MGSDTKRHDLSDGDIIISVDGLEFLLSDWGEALGAPAIVITLADGDRLSLQMNDDDECAKFRLDQGCLSVFVGRAD